ncbi:EGF-like domain-containing protein 2 [Ylistrum balloti]|uniref:EGF-like domain-containing protein 2 n=1 Tax=Ylistrum balloti TaxID=509963 RepID=UPI002905EE81|nr:EGF-like domain-containing protein 2 [Ylistrum balloti]
MFRLGIFLLCLSVVLDLSLSQEATSEQNPYNCRRNGYECKNGGKCQDGSCVCDPEYTSFDCGVTIAEQDCVDDPCTNGGICYNTDQCYCPVTHYGPTCDMETDILRYKTRKKRQAGSVMRIFLRLPVYIAPNTKQYSWECLGVEMKINMMVPEGFSGAIYGAMSRSDCRFTEETSEVTGYRKFTSSITFDNSTCAATEVKDYPMAGDITYITDVVVGFHSFIQTRNDRIISFNCTHPASNVSMEADLDSSVNQRGNLTRNEEKKTYSPVRFHFLDEDKNVLDRALYVGEKFTNMVYLISTDVYTALLLEKCVANNGEEGTQTEVVLLDNGCPTSDGNLVMQDPPGQVKMEYTPPDFPAPIPAAALHMLGFRFYDSKQVFIQCVVKICKPEDEAACAIPNCNGQAMSRKRRSADNYSNGTDEQTVSGLFTIVEEPIVLPNREIVEKESDCFRSSEIIIVIIAMSALVLVMLIACVVLATLIVRSRGKVQKLMENNDVQGLHIPRAKLTM